MKLWFVYSSDGVRAIVPVIAATESDALRLATVVYAADSLRPIRADLICDDTSVEWAGEIYDLE